MTVTGTKPTLNDRICSQCGEGFEFTGLVLLDHAPVCEKCTQVLKPIIDREHSPDSIGNPIQVFSPEEEKKILTEACRRARCWIAERDPYRGPDEQRVWANKVYGTDVWFPVKR